MIVRRGRVMVRVSRESLMGDPFWGFLGKIAKGVGKGIGGLFKALTGVGAMPMMAANVPMLPPTTGVVPIGGPGLLPGPLDILLTGGKQVGMMGADIGRAIGKRAFGGTMAAAMGVRSRRRMNPGNFRALGRALRRLESFERRARRVIRITSPRSRVRGFKIKRRRRAA